MAGSDDFKGLFTEFYDILHAGLRDVDAYIDYGRQYGPKVLELGSGTARILVPMVKAGLQVTGVDLSDDMLAICNEKLELESADTRDRARIVKGDATKMRLGEEFDLITAPCNFLNCLTGPGQAMELLNTVRLHLKPTGTFILDNSLPDIEEMVRSQGITVTMDFVHPRRGTTIVDIFTPNYDFASQIETDEIVLEERDGDRILRREETTEVLTYYFPREIRLMLETAGFQIVREQGSLLRDIPIDSSAGEMVFFCRKR